MRKEGIHYNQDRKYPYISVFNEENGFYLRTGILRDGKTTKVEPFMADFPELLDVGIMGNCVHGNRGLCQKAGIDCYQNGPGIHQAHMSLENFKRIVRECYGKTYQFALGGRGDPDQHPDFAEILKYSREYGIVPNFTTSGLGMTSNIAKLCKQYCGVRKERLYHNRKNPLSDGFF